MTKNYLFLKREKTQAGAFYWGAKPREEPLCFVPWLVSINDNDNSPRHHANHPDPHPSMARESDMERVRATAMGLWGQEEWLQKEKCLYTLKKSSSPSKESVHCPMVTSLYQAKPCVGTEAKHQQRKQRVPAHTAGVWFGPFLVVLPWTALLASDLCKQETLLVVVICHRCYRPTATMVKWVHGRGSS